MFHVCFLLQEHMKNEKSTIHNEVVTATSVPEMS
jgi:hypothetical protein